MGLAMPRRVTGGALYVKCGELTPPRGSPPDLLSIADPASDEQRPSSHSGPEFWRDRAFCRPVTTRIRSVRMTVVRAIQQQIAIV